MRYVVFVCLFGWFFCFFVFWYLSLVDHMAALTPLMLSFIGKITYTLSPVLCRSMCLLDEALKASQSFGKDSGKTQLLIML